MGKIAASVLLKLFINGYTETQIAFQLIFSLTTGKNNAKLSTHVSVI